MTIPHADRLPRTSLPRLEGFYRVALHGGYARAVAALDYPITEPALHQQVRKLEAELGVRLLERVSGRRMAPTTEGRALLDFVAPWFERLPGVLRDIMSGSAGTLLVGTEALYAEELCAPVVAGLRAEFPAARFVLFERELPDISRQLIEGALDVGVCSTRQVPDGLRFESLGRLGLRLLVPADHPLARRRKVPDIGDLAEHRYVLYAEGAPARAFTDRALSRAGLGIRVAAEASTAATMRALVRAGVAPAFVPSLGVAPRPVRRRNRMVVFDLTSALQDVAGLPEYGLLLRAARSGGLVKSFVTRARDDEPR